MTQPAPTLFETVSRSCHARVPFDLEPILQELQQRFGSSIAAILAYGSCLRGQDPRTGLLDLYVVVDSYRGAYRQRSLQWFNILLPPNVFYLQVATNVSVMRCKYTVVSLAHLEAGVTHWFLPSLWGRFAQPVRLVHARDEGIDARICMAMTAATLKFLREVTPLAEPVTDVGSLWQNGLALSYGTELRPERAGRVRELVEHDDDYYARVTAAAAPQLAPAFEPLADGLQYRNHASRQTQWRLRWRWFRRRWLGRCHSILRLAKAALTFEGGVDYAAWKIERHSGTPVEITPRVRKYPLIFGWGILWRLLRQGSLR